MGCNPLLAMPCNRQARSDRESNRPGGRAPKLIWSVSIER
jgi:hypothetical protein